MSDPPRPDERLDSLGRAARIRRGDVELWHMDDARIAARLVSLGEAGVGGFHEAADASAGVPEGPWIARRAVTPTLENLAKEARLPWRDALRVARDLSRALQ